MKNKKIILGITGSIAAYKSALLARLLVKSGAEVKVIMTPFAKEFITPLTMSTLSQSPIVSEFFDPVNGDWHSHVDMGLWADAMIIAPASANTLAKMAVGICDNVLLTTYLSAKCPVFVAPAMDLDMFIHPTTQRNLEVLRNNGNHIIEPGVGELASGLEGKGRMQEPEGIMRVLNEFFAQQETLRGRKVLVTAGPTQESLDPVRFISNHSTGKMGYCIAEALAERGAEVILVSGPTGIKVNNKRIKLKNVVTATEMYETCKHIYPDCHAAVFSAAVADYRAAVVEEQKIKKSDAMPQIHLVKNVDIAAEMGKIKTSKQINVGFALETENEMLNATEKLQRKNFDMIVLNSLNDKGAGFGGNTNKITIIDRNNNIEKFELKTKQEVADDIANHLSQMLRKR